MARRHGNPQPRRLALHGKRLAPPGDEYPASALERRPKFHFLFPHIAILTGIAWDHINIFTTFEMYLDQFRIFINKIEKDGVLIYNQTDEELNRLIETCFREDIRYRPYGIPSHTIENGKISTITRGTKAFLYQNQLLFTQPNLSLLETAKTYPHQPLSKNKT